MVHYMMNLNRHVLFALTLCGLLCPLLCLPGASAPAAGKKNASKKPSLPPNLRLDSRQVQVSLPDPKFPGKGVPLCFVKASTASGQSETTGLLGNMTQVSALLYQQGKPAATLDAPRAQGSSLRKTVVVIGMGGVLVKSLTQPGTKLTADKVAWYAALNKIVATGHVFYHDGKTGMEFRGPWLKTDTKLKSVRTGSGEMSGIF